jgi:hypothetical protein
VGIIVTLPKPQTSGVEMHENWLEAHRYLKH